MALLQTLTQVTKDRQSRHKPTDGGWSVFTADGDTYFQLDTYGTGDRQEVGTVSQSIQIDRARASDLIDVLRQTFPGL